MAEPEPQASVAEAKGNRVLKCAFAVVEIMSTLVIYRILQEKIMRVPYGEKKEVCRYSLFLVFCNCLATSVVSDGSLLASRKTIDPVTLVYNTTCQYEALKYVSFPVQTLAKCAKMIPVMVKNKTFFCMFCCRCDFMTFLF
ncbi:UAA transporter protein [Dioscorea alata]|uniref:UAA transporter protein n=1 Tax=Dioscorea alata TaxID=55571 RepID=A0ACB7VR32_DIOAL|nr:UAA transporter protein [Dioscorea alata]